MRTCVDMPWKYWNSAPNKICFHLETSMGSSMRNSSTTRRRSSPMFCNKGNISTYQNVPDVATRDSRAATSGQRADGYKIWLAAMAQQFTVMRPRRT
jgi:hypothetical protein